MRAEKCRADMTSACRGSRYLPAGVLVSLESSHMQLSGMRVRKPEVGSAIKHRPPGLRTRKISLRTASQFRTMRKRRETTMASTELEGSERAWTRSEERRVGKECREGGWEGE